MKHSRDVSRRISRYAGFTLIELVVVMALMVILFGISYPMLEHWMEGALKKAGRQVTATIEQLYERAVVTRQIYRLRFEIGKAQYRPEVLREVDGAMAFVPLSEQAALLPDGVRFLDLVTAQGTKISDGEAAVYFYPIGRMDAVIVHLDQGDGRQAEDELSLTPHPLTGRVAVSTGDFEFAPADSTTFSMMVDQTTAVTTQQGAASTSPHPGNSNRGGGAAAGGGAGGHAGGGVGGSAGGNVGGGGGGHHSR
jgi:prepilin-type N-terminal cleavage/methylation domain-containing protein